jgi:DNA-binding IclR family transcriptional regulator
LANRFSLGKLQTSKQQATAMGDEQEDKSQRAVQSIEVGGRLLLALADSLGPMTLKDLAARAGMPASRAHPYLVSFGRLRLVVQQADTGRYALGPAALQLGLTCLHQLDPLRVALPVAEALAASTGYAVALAVWGNFGPTVVRMIDARQPLHVAMRAGTVMSIFGTATGRAFAAVLPPERIEGAQARALGDESGAALPLGTGDAEAQHQAQAELRQHGVTRAQGRPIPGVNAFSAPAFDHEGTPALVITALGHQDQFPVAWQSSAAKAVRAAAAEISGRLGWRGSARA